MKHVLRILALAALMCVPWLTQAQSFLNEGFEGGSMPTGWTTDGNGTWSVATGVGGSYPAAAGAGNKNASITHGTSGDVTKLISPEMDLSSATAAVLSFMHVQMDWSGDVDGLKVYYRTSSTSAWTLLSGQDYSSEVASWTTEEDIPLPNLSSTYQIAFEFTDNWGRGVGIDEVVVMQATSCIKPMGLAASLTVGDGSVATLSWHEAGEATSWEICLNGDEDNLITATDTTYDLTGLTPEQTVTAMVRAVCDGGEYSAWSTAITFTPTDAFSITVNDGTTTNEYVPIYGLYTDDHIKSQFIIPAADLSTMQFGNVTKLTFHSSDANKTWSGAVFEVYLTETSATGVSSLNSVADMDLVYTGSLSIVNNKMEVTFTTPYQYMGGNLLVAFEQPTSGSWSSCSWYGVSATGASMGGYGTSVNQRNFLPKMTIDFIPGEEPTCFPVSGLAVVDSMTTAESVTITWIDTANSNASYNVSILGEADTTLDGTTTDTSYTFEGLQANTLYTFGVVVSCGGDEALMRTIQVRTPCVAVAFDSLPWTEGFESYTGSSSSGSSYAFNDPCWRVHDRYSNNYPYINNSYAHTGSNALATYGSSSNRTVIVLPPFEGDLSNLMLTFWQRTGSTSAYMEVGVMSNTDDASTFVSVQECRNTATSTYEQFEATFGGHTTGVIALRYNGSYNYVYVDDLTVMEAPSCLRPEGVSVSDVNETGATVHIADPNEVGSYHLVMLRGTDTVVNETVTDTVVVIDTLQHSSPFKVYVSALCDDGSETGAVSATFTTSCAIVSELPWLEDFEGYNTGYSSMPMCWDRRVFNLGTGDTVASNNGPIYVCSTGNNSSKGLFLQSNCNSTYSTPASSSALVMLPLFADQLNTLSLHFDYKYTQDASVTRIEAGVYVDAFGFVPVDTVEVGPNAGEWYYYEKAFAGLADSLDTGRFAIRYTYLLNNDYFYLYLDNVGVITSPECTRPDAVRDSVASAHEVHFTIVDGTMHNNYQFVLLNGTDTVVNVNINDTTFSVDTLQPTTTYTAHVRSICDDGSTTTAVSCTFTTPVSCPAPTGLRAVLTPGDGTVATLTWSDPSGSAWQICLNGDTNNYIVVNDSTSFSFDTLTPETTYTAKVRRDCTEAAEGYSTWSDVITFTPTDAYSITVNDGTTTNGYVPIYGYYVDNNIHSQFIIPAADLANMQYGSINKLTFYASDASVSWGTASFKVYLTETSATGVSSLSPVSGMEEVYSGSLSIVNNKMEVTFTTPYLYTGNNLLVAFEQTALGSYASCYWYGVNATGASMGGYSDNWGSYIYQRDFLPKMTIDFTPSDGNLCVPVMNLRVVSSMTDETSITLSWEDTVNNGASYNVYILGEADTTLAGTTTDTSFTVTGLTSSTAYTFGVVVSCGADDSSLMRTVQARTTCGFITDIPWMEDFNSSNVLDCWMTYDFDNNENSNWTVDEDGYAVSGYNDMTSANDWLVTPGIVVPTAAAGLSFTWRAMGNSYDGDYTHMTVLLSTSGTDTAAFTDTLYNGNPADGVWSPFSAALDDYADDTIYVAFIHDSYNDDGPMVDSVSVRFTMAPVVSIVASAQTVDINETVTFHANLVEGLSDGIIYTWSNTLAGSTIDNYTDSISITYTAAGVDTVSLTATNAHGTHTATVVVNVRNCQAIATFPFVETFDATSATRDCWNFVSNNTANVGGIYGMGFVTVSNRETWRFSSYSSASDYNQYGFSPSMDLSAYDSVNVRVVYATYSNAEELYFGYITASDTVWDPTVYYTSDSSDWQSQTFRVPGDAVKLAVHYYANYKYYAWIDSVIVTTDNDTPQPTQYTVTLSSANATMGTVSPAGATTVDEGASFSATATANDGYHFISWTDAAGAVVSTANPYTFTVTADVALTATFEANSTPTYYTVTVSSANTTMGTVSCTPSGSVEAGTSVTATATPANNHIFTGWVDANGDTVSRANPYTFTVTADVTLVGTFRYDGVGIDEAEVSNVSLFPNPATSTFTVSATGMKEATVIDLNGRTVMTQSAADGTATFDVSTLAKGTYFVRIVGEQATAVRKLVVK